MLALLVLRMLAVVLLLACGVIVAVVAALAAYFATWPDEAAREPLDALGISLLATPVALSFIALGGALLLPGPRTMLLRGAAAGVCLAILAVIVIVNAPGGMTANYLPESRPTATPTPPVTPVSP